MHANLPRPYLPPPYSDAAPQRRLLRGAAAPPRRAHHRQSLPAASPHRAHHRQSLPAPLFRNGHIVPVSPWCPDAVWLPNSAALLPTPLAYLEAMHAMQGAAPSPQDRRQPHAPAHTPRGAAAARDENHMGAAHNTGVAQQDPPDFLAAMDLADVSALLQAIEEVQERVPNKNAVPKLWDVTLDKPCRPPFPPPSTAPPHVEELPAAPIWTSPAPTTTIVQGVTCPPALTQTASLALMAFRACGVTSDKHVHTERGWYVTSGAWARDGGAHSFTTTWVAREHPAEERAGWECSTRLAVLPGTLRLYGPLIDELAGERRALIAAAMRAVRVDAEHPAILSCALFSEVSQEFQCPLCGDALWKRAAHADEEGVAVVWAAHAGGHGEGGRNAIAKTARARQRAAAAFMCVVDTASSGDSQGVDAAAALCDTSGFGWSVVPDASAVRGARNLRDVHGNAWCNFMAVHLSCMPTTTRWVPLTPPETPVHVGEGPRVLRSWLSRVQWAQRAGWFASINDLLHG